MQNNIFVITSFIIILILIQYQKLHQLRNQRSFQLNIMMILLNDNYDDDDDDNMF